MRCNEELFASESAAIHSANENARSEMKIEQNANYPAPATGDDSAQSAVAQEHKTIW